MTDLSKLSNEDLQALASNDLSKVSTEGLHLISGEPMPNPYEASMKSALANLSGTKKIMGGALAGLGGETIKNIGALTELVSPEYGKPIAQFGSAMTNAAKEANPVTGTIGQIGAYAIPQNAMEKALPTFKALLPNVAKQIGMGGAMGYGFTSGNNDERTQEALINAAVGGAVPMLGGLASKAYQSGKALIEPLYEGGKEAIIGRALRNFAGGEADKAITNLKASKPLVEGSLPTVGQASGVPSLAAYERASMNSSPEATNMLANRQAQNLTARTNALENIASPTRVEKYTSLRTKMGDDLYSDALSRTIDFTPEIQAEVKSLLKSPSIKSAAAQARKNALDKGIDISKPEGSLQGLHETKMALDDEIAKLNVIDPTSAQKARKDALTSAKGRLLDFIETVSPEYKKARETFARLSKPVEQLESISKIADKTINPEKNAFYANQFFNELKKVKKEGILSKQQIARLEAIGEDLNLKNFAETQGKPPGTNTVQNLAYSNLANEVGIPNMLRNLPTGQIIGNLAKKAGDIVYGKANKEISQKMAETMLNPQEAARLMQLPESRLNTTQAQKLARLLTLKQTTQGE